MTGRKDKCHRSNLAVNPSLTVTQVRKKQLCSKCTGTEIILRLFWIVVDMVKSTPLCRQTTTYPWQCAFFAHTNQQLNINMWTTVSCNCDIDEVDKTSLFKLSKADTCINLKTVQMLCLWLLLTVVAVSHTVLEDSVPLLLFFLRHDTEVVMAGVWMPQDEGKLCGTFQKRGTGSFGLCI